MNEVCRDKSWILKIVDPSINKVWSVKLNFIFSFPWKMLAVDDVEPRKYIITKQTPKLKYKSLNFNDDLISYDSSNEMGSPFSILPMHYAWLRLTHDSSVSFGFYQH